MDTSLMLLYLILIFVVFIAEITEDLALGLVSMLVGQMTLKAVRVDELETEATLSLTHLVCNKRHQPNHYNFLTADWKIPCCTLSCSFRLQSLLKSFWHTEQIDFSKLVCFTVICLPRFFFVMDLLQ